MVNNMYDCIVIGMGPAGMSAAIYANQAGLNTLILEENAPGGLLNKLKKIDNYLGFKNIDGPSLAYEMFEHVRNLNIKYKIVTVQDIKNENDYKVITTNKGEFKTKGIIIACGRKVKRSGIPNEDKFLNKGISYCAICDGALYKDKDVCVIGSSTLALEESEYLSKICKSVTIISNKEISFKEKDNIKLINNKKVKDFIGEENLEKIILEDNTEIKTSAAFIYYGYTSSTSFLNKYNLCDEKGYIIVDSNMKTKEDKIYACGDIIKKELYQISTAVSEGAIAATNLNKEIK